LCTVTCSSGGNNNNNNSNGRKRRRKRATGELCEEANTVDETSCNRQEGSCSNENPDELRLRFSSFIPKSKGQPWSQLGFGLEPLEMFGRKDNWFEGPSDWAEGDMYTTTNDRELAGEEGGFKIKTSIKVKPADIGNLKTENVNEETVVGESQKVNVKDNKVIPNTFQSKTAPLSKHDISITNLDSCSSLICVKAKAAFPFHSWSPAIDYKACFTLTHYKEGYGVRITGDRNIFPAYEALVNDEVVYAFYPTASGPTLWKLGFAWSFF
jgi:hypothetical protein